MLETLLATVLAEISSWLAMAALSSPAAMSSSTSLSRSPTPLAAALSRYPLTLVHDDLRPANMGVVQGPSPRLLVLDWARAAAAPPAVDLAWHLGAEWERLPWPREEAIEVYRDSLHRRLGDRFDPRWFDPQLRLALLGGAIQFLGFKAWFAVHHEDENARRGARDDLSGWWSEQVRAGLNTLNRH